MTHFFVLFVCFLFVCLFLFLFLFFLEICNNRPVDVVYASIRRASERCFHNHPSQMTLTRRDPVHQRIGVQGFWSNISTIMSVGISPISYLSAPVAAYRRNFLLWLKREGLTEILLIQIAENKWLAYKWLVVSWRLRPSDWILITGDMLVKLMV